MSMYMYVYVYLHIHLLLLVVVNLLFEARLIRTYHLPPNLFLIQKYVYPVVCIYVYANSIVSIRGMV